MEIKDDKLKEQESVLEGIYYLYCCKKASNTALTIHEFVDTMLSNYKYSDISGIDVMRTFINVNNLKGTEEAKVKKLLTMQLIKRAVYCPKEMPESSEQKMIRLALYYGETELSGICYMYDKSVFIEPNPHINHFKLSLAQIMQCNIDLCIIRYMGTARRGFDNMQLKEMLKSRFKFEEKDFAVDYAQLHKDLVLAKGAIPSAWRLREGDESQNTELAMKLIKACEEYNYQAIAQIANQSEDLKIEYNGHLIIRHIQQKFDQIVEDSPSLPVASLGIATALTFTYGRILAILYSRVEQRIQQQINDDPALAFVSQKVTVLDEENTDFCRHGDMKQFSKFFKHVKLPKHFQIDRFSRTNALTRSEDYWIYARDTRLFNWWNPERKYKFGQPVYGEVGTTKAKKVPSIFKTLEVPFTNEGIWEAFLIWFMPNARFFKVEDYMYPDEDYFRTLSTTELQDLPNFLMCYEADALPTLRIIDHKTAEISILMSSYTIGRHEVWTWTIHKRGKHIRIDKSTKRKLGE